MKRPSTLAAATFLLVLGAGCLFPKNFASKKDKPSPYLSTELETQFEQRWEEKRANDLIVQGMNPAAAKAQAHQEFQQKYSYAQPATKHP
jgi:hypothetical protein